MSPRKETRRREAGSFDEQAFLDAQRKQVVASTARLLRAGLDSHDTAVASCAHAIHARLELLGEAQDALAEAALALPVPGKNRRQPEPFDELAFRRDLSARFEANGLVVNKRAVDCVIDAVLPLLKRSKS